MGRFNLLDEPWISVVCDEKGSTKDVSMLELFENAAKYSELAGDTKTQDFAVLRILLAVLHTVFSRFDVKGNSYEYFELGDRYIPNKSVEECDLENYKADLEDTWLNIWENGKFPNIVCEYLNKWHDRFYLFDEKYPFLQVRKYDVRSGVLSKDSPSPISGKTINRLISESENKLSLFASKNEAYGKRNKEILSASEIARWLITLHGYIGLSDKVIFGKAKYKASKGWLFDLGGVYLKGSNLFETLMLNCYLPCGTGGNLENIQRPCWETTGEEQINFYLKDNNIYSLAELYTVWSRAVYIDPDFDINEPFSCRIVKLPEINHKNNFLEPMTIYSYNKNGDNKDSFTPKKHIQNQSLWRSFGMITKNSLTSDTLSYRCPGIIDWLNEITCISRREKLGINNFIQGIVSVSMADDGNATSWVPTDEIVDFLSIKDFVLTDVKAGGWTNIINDVIDHTKKVVEFTYKNYLKDIKDIRRLNGDSFVSQNIEQVYFVIDKSFKQWLSGIDVADDQALKAGEWYSKLKKLLYHEAKRIYESGSNRDFIGIVENEQIKNIATVFNRFAYFLNNDLK